MCEVNVDQSGKKTLEGSYRGLISDVAFSTYTGKAYATLVSEDFCAGEEGRNTLEQGRSMYTSKVKSIDVVDGQLVLSTRYSKYLVEGNITILEEIN